MGTLIASVCCTHVCVQHGCMYHCAWFVSSQETSGNCERQEETTATAHQVGTHAGTNMLVETWNRSLLHNMELYHPYPF